MSDKIAFRIQGSQIEAAGQSFPLGELTADILNITPEELDRLYALSGLLGNGRDQEAMEGIYALLKVSVTTYLV